MIRLACLSISAYSWSIAVVSVYNVLAHYDQGIDITTWQMASNDGLADSPCFGGYATQNDLRLFAMSVRRERLMVQPGTELIPWLTNGATGGTHGAQTDAPGVAMYNMLLQLWANGATGFNMYTDYGTCELIMAMFCIGGAVLKLAVIRADDMEIWLAMRDAIAIVTPFEDLIMDGSPVSDGTISVGAEVRGAIVSGMQDRQTHTMLLASSVTPHGGATAFSVTSSHAGSGWRLCDVQTNVSTEASTSGVAVWASEAEFGSVLVFGAQTPCHKAQAGR